ncbi:uncharacterized protein ACB058_018368 [Synchiropus picturatus]
MTPAASVVFTALLAALLAASSCAPAGLQDPCAAVRSSSRELNRAARIASVQARNGSKDDGWFDSTPVWMDDKDLCDPSTLKHRSKDCIQKIHNVLAGYWSVLQMVSEFHSCSEFVRKLKPTVLQIHQDIGRCAKSKSSLHETPPLIGAPEKVAWLHEDYLCRYTLDRLFSFSILTARVFAVGDPARHSEGSAQKC